MIIIVPVLLLSALLDINGLREREGEREEGGGGVGLLERGVRGELCMGGREGRGRGEREGEGGKEGREGGEGREGREGRGGGEGGKRGRGRREGREGE